MDLNSDNLNAHLRGLEEKVKKNPDRKEPYYWLGQLYEMLEDDHKAKQSYLDYLIRDIGFSDQEQAIDFLEKEIKSNPKNKMIYINLGQVYSYLNRFDEAEEMFKKGTCWEVFESNHYFFHAVRNSTAFRQLSRIMIQWEDNFSKIAEFLDEWCDIKIKYYFYESAVHKGMVTGDQQLGHCLVDKKEVHIVYNQMYQVSAIHEDCHAILHHIGNPMKLFDEGVALYIDHGKDIHTWLPKRKGEVYPFCELLDDEEFENKNLYIVYPQVGSFVGFLWETYGCDRIKQACRFKSKNKDKNKDDANPLDIFKAAFGRPLDVLEKEWKKYIQSLDKN
ncbi:MAG: hypothetical protein GY950_21160 [bacterium]|nr:hypothetical protein [bacterium]